MPSRIDEFRRRVIGVKACLTNKDVYNVTDYPICEDLLALFDAVEDRHHDSGCSLSHALGYQCDCEWDDVEKIVNKLKAEAGNER